MSDSAGRKRCLIMTATGAVVVVVSATQLIFSMRANSDISHSHNPCRVGPTPSPTSHSLSTDDILAGVAFSLNTLFATIYRLNVGIKNIVLGGQGSAREDYYLCRYLASQIGMGETIIVVPSVEVGVSLTQKLAGKHFSFRIVVLDQGELSTAMVPYDLTKQQKKALQDRLIVLTQGSDAVFGGLMLLPLTMTTLLGLFYSFRAYGLVKSELEYLSYAVVPLQAWMKFYFRFDSTLLAGVKLKDHVLQKPLEAFFYSLLPVAGITYFAMPYGLYYSHTILNGVIAWFADGKFGASACDMQEAATLILWLTNLSFALGAIEGFKGFLSQPFNTMKDWCTTLGVGLLPIALVGGVDAYFSGYKYAGLLLDDDQEGPDILLNIMLYVYLLMYILYYSVGNITDVTYIVDTLKTHRQDTDYCSFFGNKTGERAALLPVTAVNDDDELDPATLKPT